MDKIFFDKCNRIISSAIDDLDKNGFKKIIASKGNKKPERLIEFLRLQENVNSIKGSLQSLQEIIYNSDYNEFENIDFVEKTLHIIESFKNNIYDLNGNSVIDFLLNLIIYTFLHRIYRLDNDFNSRNFIFEINSDNDFLYTADDDGMFFRGQTVECAMSPSIIRNLKKNVSISWKMFEDLIGDKDRKYKAHIKSDLSIYEKMAYFQHSTNYSPLLDFTSNKLIAISFALSNSNNFNSNDSVVYGIQRIDKFNDANVIKEKSRADAFFENDFCIDEIDSDGIIFFKHYSLSTTCIDKSTGVIKRGWKNVIFKSFNDLFDKLTPKIKIIDIKTNDRMKYQHGLFLVFYGCVSLRGRIYFELNTKFNLYKFFIRKENKRFILDKIYKNFREYDYKHLMDPYLFLSE